MSAFNLTAEIQPRLLNVRNIAAQLKKELAITAPINIKFDGGAQKNAKAMASVLSGLNKELAAIGKNSANANAALKSLGSTFSQLNNAGNKSANIAQNLKQVKKSTDDAATSMQEFGRVSGLALRRNSGFLLATTAVFGLGKAITSSFSDAIKFERELVKIAQVSGRSVSSLSTLNKTITSLAKGLGVSSLELANVAQTLAQAGLSANQTEKALGALAKTTLAATFGNIQDTTEGAIALMAQFGIQAKDLEKSLGSVNKVAAEFAVESDDVIAAIKRAGGVFAATSKGVTEGRDALNEFIAVFTSVRATTRESAETIATGLRTIFTRIQRPQTIAFLKELGINLTDLQGKFVGPFEAVNRLSRGLKGLDTRNPLFAQVIEELGGFRQVGKVIPLLSATETRLKALRVAQSGSNSLTEDTAQAQQALAVQIEKTRENFNALIRDISQTETFKALVSTILGVTNALIRFGESIKPILPLIAGLALFKGTSSLLSFTKGFIPGAKGRGAKFHRGGLIPGRGTKDEVPATLQSGEFVIRRQAVDAVGVDRLDAINSGRVGFADGGDTSKADFLKASKDRRKAKVQQRILDANAQLTIGTEDHPLIGGLFVQPIQGKADSVNNSTLTSSLFTGLLKKAGIVPDNFKGNLKIPVASNFLDAARAKKFNTSAANNISQSIYNTSKIFGIEQSDANFNSTIDTILKDIGINDVSGKIFEGAVSSLAGITRGGGNSARGIDFVGDDIGKLNKLSSVFGTINTPYVDAKYASTSDVNQDLRKKLLNELGNNPAIAKSFQQRGLIRGFAKGGRVNAMLTKGEYVINKNAASSFGYDNLNTINAMGFARGGKFDDEDELLDIPGEGLITRRNFIDEREAIARQNALIEQANATRQERNANVLPIQVSGSPSTVVASSGPSRSSIRGFRKNLSIRGRAFNRGVRSRFGPNGPAGLGLAAQIGGVALANQIGGPGGDAISGGIAGQAFGSSLGGIGGSVLGGLIGGPAGAALGGTIGKVAGGIGGAAFGALSGFFDAKQAKDIELAAKAMNKSIGSVEDAMARFAKDGNVAALEKSFKGLGSASVKNLQTQNTPGFFNRGLNSIGSFFGADFGFGKKSNVELGQNLQSDLATAGAAAEELIKQKFARGGTIKGSLASLSDDAVIALASSLGGKKTRTELAKITNNTDLRPEEIVKLQALLSRKQLSKNSILAGDKASVDQATKLKAVEEAALAANKGADLLAERLENLSAVFEKAAVAGADFEKSNEALLSRRAGGAGIRSQVKENIFKNTRAASIEEVGAQAVNINQALGNTKASQEFARTLIGAKSVEQKLPALLNAANKRIGAGETTDTAITSEISKNLGVLPKELQNKLKTDLLKEIETRQSGPNGLGASLAGGDAGRFAKDFGRSANEVAAKFVDVFNKNIQEYEGVLNQWVQLQAEANRSFDAFTQTVIENDNIIKELSGGRLTRGDRTRGFQAEVTALGRRAGLKGEFGIKDIVGREASLNDRLQGSFSGSPEEIARQMATLTQEQQNSRKVLETIASNTSEQAALQQDLNSIIDSRGAARKLLEDVQFGGPAKQLEIQRQIQASKLAESGVPLFGSLGADARAGNDIRSIFAGAQSPAAAKRFDQQQLNLTANNPFAQSIFRQIQGTGLNQGTNLPDFLNRRDLAPLINELRNANSRQQQAQQALANIDQRDSNKFLENGTNAFRAKTDALTDKNGLLDRLNATLEQLPQSIEVGGNVNVTLNIPGAEVLADLAPSVQRLIETELNRQLDKRINKFDGSTNSNFK